MHNRWTRALKVGLVTFIAAYSLLVLVYGLGWLLWSSGNTAPVPIFIISFPVAGIIAVAGAVVAFYWKAPSPE